MMPLLEVTNFSYAYPDTEESIFSEGISFSVSAGECVCLTGPSGCGKTTLLLAIQGLLREGEVGGSIKIAGNNRAVAVGMVFQNAESQILCTTVEDEVAFGPENLGLPAEEITSRVHESLDAVGLSGFENRNVEELSAGEQHRLTIASVLSLKPGLLLLDEPTCQLDAPGKERLISVLQRLKNQGQALLVADHDLHPYRDIANRFIFLDNGQPHQTIDLSESIVSHDWLRGKDASQSKEKLAIVVDDLQVLGIAPDRPSIFRDAHLKVYEAELIHLFGLNGAGKSTLLRCLVGFVTPDAGTIQIGGISPPRPEHMLGKVGLLSQNPQRQIFEDTVFAEVAFSLKRMRLSHQDINERVAEALALSDIPLLAERSPLTLSFGEQHRVALASAIATHPEVLLFDEPFSGLDFLLRKRILEILTELRRSRRTTVLIASHDPLPLKNWADRSVVVEQGKLYAS